MNVLTDYHTHSTFSPDGRSSPMEMCHRALAMGYREIAFTEHVEWHLRAPYQPDFDNYFETIEACRARYGPRCLDVLTGVEMGKAHTFTPQARSLLRTYSFDVTVASLHWLDADNIHMRECFTGRSPRVIYEHYFSELGAMIATVDAGIIGHFDRILWRGSMCGARFDAAHLEPIICSAWQLLIARNVARHPWHQELVLMLRWFREEGGTRVLVNSDAHATHELGLNLPLAHDLLRFAGLTPLPRIAADRPSPASGRQAIEREKAWSPLKQPGFTP